MNEGSYFPQILYASSSRMKKPAIKYKSASKIRVVYEKDAYGQNTPSLQKSIMAANRKIQVPIGFEKQAVTPLSLTSRRSSSSRSHPR